MSASDNEIELAVGGQAQPAPASAEVPTAPPTENTSAPPTATAAPTTEPAVAPDLAAIQAMVAAGAVVGADPAPAIPAAEKRAQVEADLAARGLQPAQPQPDSDSESSSEYESSDEDEPRPKKPAPLTNAEEGALRSKLDQFYGYDVVSDSEEDEEDDDELAMLEQMGLADEDSGPVMSAHEQPLPPVPAPPMAQLPADMPTTLAGEIVSWMKDKQVENWLAKKAGEEAKGEQGEQGEEKADEPMVEDKPAEPEAAEVKPESTEVKQETGAQPADVDMAAADVKPDVAAEASDAKPETSKPDAEPKSEAAAETKPATPKFTSAGTLIIRAAPLPGYLESGSILATSSGAVLGVVFDTFGPLTQPFYNLRLPPPPYSVPAINPGEKVYVPASAEFRFFVDMAAVRDPRFQSDASNVYDEEVGDEEREWSDDEKEAEAKRAKKQRRKAKRGGAAGPELPGHLPPRPEFDAAGGREIVSYEDEAPTGAPVARGRGRGGSRGGERGGRGRGGRGRGQGRAIAGDRGGQQQFPGFTNNPAGLPNMPYAPAGYNPMQPGMGMGMGMGGFNPMMMGMGGMAMPMQGFGFGGQQQYPQQPYGGQQQQQPYAQQGQQQGQQQQQQGQQAPAINPRFAQQYGFWPQNQGEGPYSE